MHARIPALPTCRLFLTATLFVVFAATVPCRAADAAMVARGEAIARQKCDTCHTLRDAKGQPVVGLFGGGKVIGGAAAANLTRDPSGISYYDEKLFLEVLRTNQVSARKLKPVMSSVGKGLSDDDLKAVFAYLTTLPPVQHRIDNTEPPSDCKLCRQKHGAGDRN